jgi:hypothetical protein
MAHTAMQARTSKYRHGTPTCMCVCVCVCVCVLSLLRRTALRGLASNPAKTFFPSSQQVV